MNFHQIDTTYYCGIDLHSKSMYVCIMNKEGKIHLHRNMRNDFEIFKRSIQPFIQSLSVGCETSGYYYWLADGCREAGIPFHLGHALYMTAISGKKNDRIDSKTITNLMRTNFLPYAFTYPPDWRSTRDLLRRRHRLVRIRAEAYSHVQATFKQQGIMDSLSKFVKTVQKFSSYAGLVKCERESAGKNTGGAKGKIRNAFLKHAFSEIILTAQVGSPKIKKYYEKMKSKHGQKKARAMIAHKFGVAIYFMLKNGEVFDENRFVNKK